MQYRTLGKTGIQVSVLGLGCAALGGVYGEVDQQQATRTVHTALDLGINYLDTAPLYGRTRSETATGIALRGVPRDRYFLSSKVGRYDVEEFDFSYPRVKSGLEATISRLGCQYLDIAILHDIEFAPLDVVLNEGYKALDDARREGKIRFIGASGLPLKIFPAILSQVELDVVISYAHYTLQNRRLAGLLPVLETYGVGVVNASPLGLGLLTPSGPQPWHLASEPIKAACRQAAAWCQAHGIDIAQLGMQFALSNPRIHTNLTGAKSEEEVRRNVQAVGRQPDPDVMAQIERILEPVRDQSWPSGRPEYN